MPTFGDINDMKMLTPFSSWLTLSTFNIRGPIYAILEGIFKIDPSLAFPICDAAQGRRSTLHHWKTLVYVYFWVFFPKHEFDFILPL